MSDLVHWKVVAGDSGRQPRSFLDSESDSLKEFLELLFDGLVLENENGLLSDRVDLLSDGLDELQLERVGNQKDIVLSGPLLDELGFLGNEVDFLHGLGLYSF